MNTISFLLKIKDIKNNLEKIEKFTKSDEYYLIKKYTNLPTRREIERELIEIEIKNLLNEIDIASSNEIKDFIYSLIKEEDFAIIDNFDKINEILKIDN